MPIYRSEGKVPPKQTTLMKGPHGDYCHEELMTHEGFDGDYTFLYRLRAPTSMGTVERLERIETPMPDETPLQNYLFHVDRVEASGDFLASRKTLFVGEHVSWSMARPTEPTDGFYRNAWSDELVLITEGRGTLRSVFGELRYRELDLVHVPRSVTVQWCPDAVPHSAAIIESTAPIKLPPHFRNPANGQFRPSSPYKERDIRVSEFSGPIDEVGEFPTLVKYGDQLSRFWLDHHPFDAVGWDGCLYPFAVNLEDYDPIVGNTDRLPDQYQVFVTHGTMIMAIVPRRRADHPDASPGQPHHVNSDIDEILYRIGGSNRATDPNPGTITLHPRGLSHGPRPGFLDQPKTDRLPLYGLMLDTGDHLRMTTAAQEAMDASAFDKWRPS
jgi:homogentisate 1,2-dioxygenase